MLESASLFAAIGDAWGEAIVLGALGWLDTGRGDFSEERTLRAGVRPRPLRGRRSIHRPYGHEPGRAPAGQGHPDEARDALDIALTAHEAVRLYDGLSYGLEAAARLAWNDGRSEDAARLLGAADGLRDEVGVPIWGPRLSRFETLVRSVRNAVGDTAFEAAWVEGRALGFDASLATARDVLHGAAAGTRF